MSKPFSQSEIGQEVLHRLEALEQRYSKEFIQPFGVTTVPAAREVHVAGSPRDIMLRLPSHGTDVAISIGMRPKTAGVRVAIIPPRLGKVSDGFVTSHLPIFLAVDHCLDLANVDGTWALQTFSPPAALTADFVASRYSVGYLSEPSSITFSDLFSLASGLNRTYIDTRGKIRDVANANDFRITHDVAPPFTCLGLMVETASVRNNTANSMNPTWAGSPQPIESTDIQPLYQGILQSAAVYKAMCSSSSQPILAFQTTNSLTSALTTFVYQIYVWIPAKCSADRVYLTMGSDGGNTSVWTQLRQVDADLSKRDQWQKLWVCATQISGGTGMGYTLRQQGMTAGDIIYCTFPQLIGRSVSSGPPVYGPCSDVPTNGVTATRSTETFAAGPRNAVSLLSGGSLIVEGYSLGQGVSGLNSVVEYADSLGTTTLGLRVNGEPYAPFVDVSHHEGSTQVWSTKGLSIANSGYWRAALATHDLDMSFAIPGASSSADYPTPRGLAHLNISGGTSTTILRRIEHFPTRLIPVALQSRAETTGPYAITVDPGTISGPTIPLDFVGLSFETSAVQQTLSLDENISLRAIISVLGSNGVIRFGGNTSDYISFSPSSARISKAAKFVNSLGPGWSVIWGLNMRRNDASVNASQANALANVLGDERITYQIGNEPGYDNNPVDYHTYLSRWQLAKDQLVAARPLAAFSGPDVGSSLTWISDFASDKGAQVVALTKHHYGSGGNDSTVHQRSDITSLWSNDSIDYAARSINQSAAPYNLKVRMTEFGPSSWAGEGNTLGEALWCLRAMGQLATNRCSGVNFHCGDAAGSTSQSTGGYLPFSKQDDNTYVANSTLYAMVLFNYFSGCTITAFERKQLPAHVFALAAKSINGDLHVLLCNFDIFTKVIVDIGSTAWFNEARALIMTGCSYASTELHIGFAKIRSDGFFSPESIILDVAESHVEVVVPPSSAVLVTLT